MRPHRPTSPDTRERGATAVEYSFIVALIAAIIVLTVQAVGLDTVTNWAAVDW
mgnify:CR=1 FL=1